MTNKQILHLLHKKAMQSCSKFRISAIGLNGRGECVDKAFNKPRFLHKGGGIHAEMQIMRSAREKGIKTIFICRINNTGKFLPIQPCETCQRKADELGIRIISI